MRIPSDSYCAQNKKCNSKLLSKDLNLRIFTDQMICSPNIVIQFIKSIEILDVLEPLSSWSVEQSLC